jgi:hypothetical protein
LVNEVGATATTEAHDENAFIANKYWQHFRAGLDGATGGNGL